MNKKVRISSNYAALVLCAFFMIWGAVSQHKSTAQQKSKMSVRNYTRNSTRNSTLQHEKQGDEKREVEIVAETQMERKQEELQQQQEEQQQLLPPTRRPSLSQNETNKKPDAPAEQKQIQPHTHAPKQDQCTLQHFQENHWNCQTRKFQHNCNTRDLIAGLSVVDNLHFVGDSLSRNRFMTAALELTGDLPLNKSICPGVEWTLDYFIEQCRSRACLHEKYNRQHYAPHPLNLTVYHDIANWKEGAAPGVAKNLKPNDIMVFSFGAWINYDIAYHVPRIKRTLAQRPNRGELIIWMGMNHVGHLKDQAHLNQGQNNTNAMAYNEYMRQHYQELGLDGYVDFFNLTRDADLCAQQENDTALRKWANFDGTHATAEPNRMMLWGLLTYLKDHNQNKTNKKPDAPAEQKQIQPHTHAPKQDQCTLQHFQENHWNCQTRKFQHNCNTRDLIAGLSVVDNLHFVGDSLSRNRFMTAALELTGDLPLNKSICPGVEWTLDYFIEQCRSRACLHEKYNRQHYAPHPLNLTVYHDIANWKEGAAPGVAKNLKPNDIMVFSFGAWINYDIAYHVPRIKRTLAQRPNRGELIIWMGMNHVGHLKDQAHLNQGQNNTNAMAYNEYMRQHYQELGLDGYVDFFNLTRDADLCAQQENDTALRKWANFDGTHATAEPNRMMLWGLLTYLKDHNQNKTNKKPDAPAEQKQIQPHTHAPKQDQCTLQHFQENHWNCQTRKFQHNCNTRDLIAGLSVVDNLHFVGDSLSRNRFMTAALELTGDLPLNKSICPGVEWTLDYFIEQCRSRACLHEKYNRQHYAPHPLNLTVYHDIANWKEGAAPGVAKNLKPNDIMVFSFGAWINYDIAYHVPRIKRTLAQRPNRGELIIWMGMNHVGHLKDQAHLNQGQNNTNAMAYNEYMRQHYQELGLDGYVDFFNLTRDADLCAQQENDTALRKWANFDGTHATAEPNRMMLWGLLTYLKDHNHWKTFQQQKNPPAQE